MWDSVVKKKMILEILKQSRHDTSLSAGDDVLQLGAGQNSVHFLVLTFWPFVQSCQEGGFTSTTGKEKKNGKETEGENEWNVSTFPYKMIHFKVLLPRCSFIGESHWKIDCCAS